MFMNYSKNNLEIIFKEGELDEKSNMQKMHNAFSDFIRLC